LDFGEIELQNNQKLQILQEFQKMENNQEVASQHHPQAQRRNKTQLTREAFPS
jgi:glucuronate isomerase